jgi:hypothetical protein
VTEGSSGCAFDRHSNFQRVLTRKLLSAPTPEKHDQIRKITGRCKDTI